MAKLAISTDRVDTRRIGAEVESMVLMASTQRQNFERKWYDNNFFDDGYHFRYVSRTTGRLVDLQDRDRLNVPTRNIPKASAQIRGIANILLQPDFVPVVYPEKVTRVNYQGNEQEYETALKLAKDQAQRIGHWIEEEWKDQELTDKLMLMVILAAKNSTSFLQVYPDPVKEEIKTKVFDGFDIYLMGNLTDIQDSPFLVKAHPTLVSEIEANELFDEKQRSRVLPDNKYAESKVKEGYMQSRFGSGQVQPTGKTVIMKEAFIKEYLSDKNKDLVAKLGKKHNVMEGKKMGDLVMRHTFVANGVWLLDEYIDLEEYPFVDFRFEPGPIYQVSKIERFIPANKSLDLVMSRIERIIGTMAVGVYQKRRGEDFQITNRAGGQIIEYEATPLTQMNMAGLPSHIFGYINQINDIIEEQGASTSALSQLPSGVKSGVAIENLKASEFMNLKIPSNMLKRSVKRISEMMIQIASKSFMNPQTVNLLERGEPQYFDIIGEAGIKARQELNEKSPDAFELPDAIEIKKDVKVRIEVESGLGFTMEGKKATMQQIINYVVSLAEQGLIGTEGLKEVTRRFLEVYQFGSTQEFMEAFDKGMQTNQLSQDQTNQMKIAMLEVLDDTGVVGKKAEEQDILKAKIGATEAISDIGEQKNKQVARGG